MMSGFCDVDREPGPCERTRGLEPEHLQQFEMRHVDAASASRRTTTFSASARAIILRAAAVRSSSTGRSPERPGQPVGPALARSADGV